MGCYFKYNFGGGPEIDRHDGTGPCAESKDGEIVQCCEVGDLCMGNGLCQGLAATTSRGSPFYVAGCTDAQFKDSVCPQTCVDQSTSDIIYDYRAGIWKCCGSNCSDPVDESMSAPPPVKLQYIATIASDSSFIPLATGVALLTTSGSLAATDSPLQQSAAASAGGISPGAAAGITLGAILGLIVLLALGGFFIWRAKGRPKLMGCEKSQYVYRPDSHEPQSAHSTPPAELAGPAHQAPPPPRPHEVGIESPDQP